MGAEAAVVQESDPVREALAGGDARTAIALCARQYGASIGRLCMGWLGSQAEAEEAVQETLLAAFDGAAHYRGEGSVPAWLYGIARRVCARRVEVRGRRERQLRLVGSAPERPDGADEQLSARRRGERLRLALEQLKPSERDAVVLRFEGGLSFREVGESCGIDEATARKRVSRALEKLRSTLVDA
ncbi:MAG: sigma-70 family RNA polymerase sigma factor [Myxococcaceae bacterium]|nr:MAG: sigma-70 family RNA polymerase sigma factor [Myxococcaceae bacterium]